MTKHWVITIWVSAIIVLGLLLIQFLRHSGEITIENHSNNNGMEIESTISTSSVDEESETVEIETTAENIISGKLAGTEQQASVTGYVVNAQTGKPIEGARMSLNNRISPSRDYTTDKNGMYTFDALSRGNYYILYEGGKGMPPLRYWISPGTYVSQKEKKNQGHYFSVTSTDKIQGPDFELTYGLTLSGRVQDTEGKPIDGVKISVKSLVPEGKLSGLTKQSGSFKVHGLCVASGLSITAEKHGYLQVKPIEGFFLPKEGRSGLVITMNKAGSIMGTVLDQDNEPVDKVRVHLWEVGGDAKYKLEISKNQFAARNQKLTIGQFSFTSLAKATYNLYVERLPRDYGRPYSGPYIHRKEPTFPTKDTEPWAVISLGEAEDVQNVQLKMRIHKPDSKSLATFNGIVRNSAGEPIEGVSASVRGQAYSDGVTASTDIDGKFTLENVSSKRIYDLKLYHPDYTKVEMQSVLNDKNPTAFTMQPTVSIAGTLLDEVTRKPIQDFSIAATKRIKSWNLQQWLNVPAKHHPEGKFNIPKQDAGKGYIVIQARGYQPKKIEVDIVAEDIKDLEILMTPSARILGTVTNEKGAPVQGAKVYLGEKYHVVDASGKQ